MRREPGMVRDVRVNIGMLVGISMLGLLTGCRATHAPSSAPSVTAVPAAVRITMAELHAAGGVPPGWRFTPPPGDPHAGRQAFIDFGCSNCHAVQGESFSAAADGADSSGPDLSGMGSQHPAEYFAESILNPNAVIVDAPGYVGPDGRSIMPAYPEMTVRQLADLVAYLQSLTAGGAAHTHVHRPGRTTDLGASSFYVQAYAVQPEQLDGFYDWFEREEFRRYPGLMSVQTYVGRRQGDLLVVAVFGFDTDAAMGRFMKEMEAAPAAGAHDFTRPVQRYILRSPTMYKANGMWVP